MKSSGGGDLDSLVLDNSTKKNLIEVWLIHNVTLVAGVQHSESVFS